MKKEIIIFGAGKIGRAFLVPIFLDGGYKVYLSDTDNDLMEQLSNENGYNLVTKDQKSESLRWITGFEVLPFYSKNQISEKLSQISLISSSVCMKGLPELCRLLKEILPTRGQGNPLDMILAENIKNGADYCRKLLTPVKGIENLGIVEAVIGKTVPMLSEKERKIDALRLYTDSYNTLVLDRNGFKGDFPAIENVKLVSPIQAYMDRKLYIHNLGHAACAYLGRQAIPERTMIWEVLEDKNLLKRVRETMLQSARCLQAEYPDLFSMEELTRYIDNLISGFRNRSLDDTVYRVGRDIKRKLAPGDRIMGALELAKSHNLPWDLIDQVRQAACQFGNYEPSDEQDRQFSMNLSNDSPCRAHLPFL